MASTQSRYLTHVQCVIFCIQSELWLCYDCITKTSSCNIERANVLSFIYVPKVIERTL